MKNEYVVDDSGSSTLHFRLGECVDIIFGDILHLDLIIKISKGGF